MPDNPQSREGLPQGVDPSKANVARVYDCFLDGKDNFEADREVYRRILEVVPESRHHAKDHRAWLIRAVRFMAGEAGIDQFLDCGAGLPTVVNTHEAAQRVNPDATVVYVDHDPVVLAHGRALLARDERTSFIGADLTKTHDVLGHPVITEKLDFTRPIGLIQCGTMHHVDDEQDPHQIMADYVAALPPGSHVALTHWFDADDGSPRSRMARQMEERFRASSMGSGRFRRRQEIAALFDGLELVEPGLTYMHEWRPDLQDEPVGDEPRLATERPRNDADYLFLAGVGRKDAP